MGALASVVVSPRCCAVSGSHPDCLSLAPPARCPRPVLLLPSGFGRCSANNGENKCICTQILGLFEGWLYSSGVSFSITRIVILDTPTTLHCKLISCVFLFFFSSSGQIWAEACGRSPQRGTGGRQVGII